MAQVDPGTATYNQQTGATVVQVAAPEPRKSYVILSVISFFCSPLCGIIALICGCCSKCKYDDGDYSAGSCLARCSCGWALTGIITTLLIAIAIVILFFAAPQIFWALYIIILAKAHGLY